MVEETVVEETVVEEPEVEVVEEVAVVEPVEPEPEPIVEEVVAAEAVRSAVVDVPLEPDDLKKVEGIGPKIAGILNDAGIVTFEQLSKTDVETLDRIVRQEAGITIANPGTWPEQAALAAEGQWDILEKLQDELKGGRRV